LLQAAEQFTVSSSHLCQVYRHKLRKQIIAARRNLYQRTSMIIRIRHSMHKASLLSAIY
jgi:hypothetical protein